MEFGKQQQQQPLYFLKALPNIASTKDGNKSGSDVAGTDVR